MGCYYAHYIIIFKQACILWLAQEQFGQTSCEVRQLFNWLNTWIAFGQSKKTAQTGQLTGDTTWLLSACFHRFAFFFCHFQRVLASWLALAFFCSPSRPCGFFFFFRLLVQVCLFYSVRAFKFAKICWTTVVIIVTITSGKCVDVSWACFIVILNS